MLCLSEGALDSEEDKESVQSHGGGGFIQPQIELTALIND